MVVEFKQAVNFFGKFYKLGINEVPAEVVSHPYFALMQKSGLAFEVASPLGGLVQQPRGLVQQHKDNAINAEKAAESLKTAPKREDEEPSKKQKKG